MLVAARIESLESRRLLSANNILADFGGIYPTQSVTVNGTSYFAANDGVHGSELWKSDGTINGTSLVKDLQPGKSGSTPTGFNVIDGHVLFFAEIDTSWYLFTTDGTAAGTTALVTVQSNDAWHGVALSSQYQIVSGKLIFTTAGGGNDADVWDSDGTQQGTALLKSIPNFRSGIPGGGVDASYTIGNNAVFKLHGTLIVTDGTAVGTAELPHGDGKFYVSNLSAMQGKLYYLELYTDDLSKGKLYETDGTVAGTTIVEELPTGMEQFSDFTIAGEDKIYFEQIVNISKHVQSFFLWSSDGSAAGTAMVGQIDDGIGTDDNVEMPDGRLVIFLMTGDPAHPFGIESTDGTPNTPLTFVSYTPYGGGGDLTLIGGTIFFLVDPNQAGEQWQLWRTDATAQGTTKIQDLGPWTVDNSSYVYSLANVNNQLVVTTDTRTFTYDPATMAAPIGSAVNTRTLGNGILRIFGTAADDFIRIYDVNGDPDRFIVDLNGNRHSFAYSDVSRIYVYGYAGNDNIAVNEKTGAFTIRTEVWAGDGNDSIYTAEGRDTIYGDAGDDAMFGGNNNDLLSGGAGDDTILAGNGNDTVTGDDGADSIQGNKGNDILSGGDDQNDDTINGGAGENVLFGQSVYDTFFSNKPDAGIPVDDVLQD